MADHLSPELLQRYQAGALDTAERELAEEHLASCVPCRERLDRLSGSAGGLDAVYTEAPVVSRRSSAMLFWIPLQAALVALLVGGVLYFTAIRPLQRDLRAARRERSVLREQVASAAPMEGEVVSPGLNGPGMGAGVGADGNGPGVPDPSNSPDAGNSPSGANGPLPGVGSGPVPGGPPGFGPGPVPPPGNRPPGPFGAGRPPLGPVFPAPGVRPGPGPGRPGTSVLPGGPPPIAAPRPPGPAPILPEKPAGNVSSLIGRPGRAPTEAGSGVPFALHSPVGTVVQTDRPVLRWAAVEGAESYVVTLTNTATPAEKIVSPALTETEWTVTRALKRGVTYTWQVAAKKAEGEVRSPVAPASDARFAVLSDAGVKALQQAEQAARREQTEARVRLGVLLARTGLLDEAEKELQAAAEADPKSDSARKQLARVRAWRARRAP